MYWLYYVTMFVADDQAINNQHAHLTIDTY